MAGPVTHPVTIALPHRSDDPVPMGLHAVPDIGQRLPAKPHDIRLLPRADSRRVSRQFDAASMPGTQTPDEQAPDQFVGSGLWSQPLRREVDTSGERPAQSGQRARRWSADAWIALRQGGTSLSGGGFAAPVYGASQAGAVLRYDLASGSPSHPAVYARVVQALDGRHEGDLAAGLSARPLASVPLTGHIEARASHRGGQVEVRPAAFFTAGMDEAALPLGVRARGYAQAGYVGGRDATAFADGSLVTERKLLGMGETNLGAGAGLWGGAQRGSERLDIGPSASLRFRLGEGRGRVAVDYRVRVAGNAAPASGAAVTVSAGF